MMFHLPNLLTLSRIAMAVLFIFFYRYLNVVSLIVCIVIVVGSIVTDYWDGKLARKNKLVTNFGKIADPLTDSILYITIFVCFSYLTSPSWMTVPFFWTVTAREFFMHAFLRPFMLTKKIVIAAQYSGKVKTVMQCIASITTLTFIVFVKILKGLNVFFASDAEFYCRTIIDVLFAIVVFLSLYSFFQYLMKSIRLLSANK